ncbi:MAG: cupin domain-containing protein [Candidatus Choladocola sp.]|nr:cupin domain-containing protein [Candidatus Choladocola sp.]
MVRKAEIKIAKEVRGGKGEVEFHHIVTKEELNGHGDLYAMVRLKPGCSIGYHQHVGNTEPYYILQGHGTFVDNDGSRIEVGPGDVCYIEVGQSHAMENNSDEDLVFMALIYNECKFY